MDDVAKQITDKMSLPNFLAPKPNMKNIFGIGDLSTPKVNRAYLHAQYFRAIEIRKLRLYISLITCKISRSIDVRYGKKILYRDSEISESW